MTTLPREPLVPPSRGLALALFAAPWGFVVANASYAWASRNGLNDNDGAHALKLSAAYPGLLHIAVLGGMIACLLMVPAALGAMRVVGSRSRKLGGIGGSLVAAGYICYFGVLSTSFTTLAMARRGGPLADYAAVIDSGQQDGFTVWVFLLFVLGNIVGTFVLGLGLLRSRAVPAWAAGGIMAWPVLHIVGLTAGSEWFEVAGAVIQGVGFAVVGARLLASSRTDSSQLRDEVSAQPVEA